MLPNGHTSILAKLLTLYSTFQKVGLFATKFKLSHFLFGTRYEKVNDGFGWMCQNGSCAKYKKIHSHGKFFRPKQYSDTKMATFNLHVVKTNFKQTDSNANRPLRVCYQYCFCVSQRNLRPSFAKKTLPGWGPGMIVQAGESCFSEKLKNHR